MSTGVISRGGFPRSKSHRSGSTGRSYCDRGRHPGRPDRAVPPSRCEVCQRRLARASGCGSGEASESPHSGLSCSAVAGAEKDSLANPIMTSGSYKSGLAPFQRRDSLPKARSVRSEDETFCTAIQRVWLSSPSLIPPRNSRGEDPLPNNSSLCCRRIHRG